MAEAQVLRVHSGGLGKPPRVDASAGRGSCPTGDGGSLSLVRVGNVPDALKVSLRQSRSGHRQDLSHASAGVVGVRRLTAAPLPAACSPSLSFIHLFSPFGFLPLSRSFFSANSSQVSWVSSLKMGSP